MPCTSKLRLIQKETLSTHTLMPNRQFTSAQAPLPVRISNQVVHVRSPHFFSYLFSCAERHCASNGVNMCIHHTSHAHSSRAHITCERTQRPGGREEEVTVATAKKGEHNYIEFKSFSLYSFRSNAASCSTSRISAIKCARVSLLLSFRFPIS